MIYMFGFEFLLLLMLPLLIIMLGIEYPEKNLYVAAF
jgi:hypothetical protein